ncbi:hypothetical protein ABZS81_24725 [Streptomyces sp. NPDC005318]|uniref:hypothetical protein n=1 Tax=Streptomyces sp. NPDC005318 TaxID=3157031 RepID=UPI0033A7AB1C
MASDGPDSVLVLTPDSVRGLAHPLRTWLPRALRRGGPATASELVAELDSNTGVAAGYRLGRPAGVGPVVGSSKALAHGQRAVQPDRDRGWRASVWQSAFPLRGETARETDA